MENMTGKIFISSNTMDDDNFKTSTIFITEHNSNGVMAFVINKIDGRKLNELVEFNTSPAFDLFNGGPVDQEHLFFIHRKPELINGGTEIIDGIYLGGNFKQAVNLINNKKITHTDLKIFIGYCGWDKDEMEAEINEGSWVLTDNNLAIVFDEKQF